MNYELTGKLTEKFEAIQRTEKFKVREFIVEEVRQAGSNTFTNVIKFQLSNDKCSLIDNFEKGTEIKVHFNISGRSWEKEGKVSYFTNLEAWKIEQVGAPSGLTTENLPEIPADMETPPLGNDDLPF
jgi:uncharacterized protein DUF3127